jgi:membrane fusion protein (multidrug efflux system)
VRSEGSLVTAGDESSLLTYLVQTDRLYVEFSIPDADAQVLRTALLAPGANVSVHVSAAGVAFPNTARIEFLAPRVDDATGTVAVRALLDNAGGELLPGQVVRARIDGVAVSDALVIPRRAVLRGAQGAFVWKIDAANSVVPTPVELGIGSANDTVVTRGLSNGDHIVVDGILKVQPGAPVNATPLESAAAGNSSPGG